MVNGLSFVAIDENIVKVTGICRVTHEIYSIEVPAEGLDLYLSGAYIQVAFPGVPASQREFLVSGISPEGWEITFGNQEEDDDSIL